MPTPSPAPRPALPLATALDEAAPLASLMQRVQASQACLAAIGPLLPEGLRSAVQAGPLDDKGWTLLVNHAAAAAKLRQLLPRLEACLRDRTLPGIPLRIKVLPPRAQEIKG